MKPGYRILLSVYITFMFYAIVSMVWGTSGLIQTEKLKSYKEKLEQNTLELSQISSSLVSQSKRLRTDSNLIAVKARDLGFFREGEGEIIIKGYNKNSINYSVGSYYNKYTNEMDNRGNIRIYSSIIGFLFFLILSIFSTKSKLNNKIYQ